MCVFECMCFTKQGGVFTDKGLSEVSLFFLIVTVDVHRNDRDPDRGVNYGYASPFYRVTLYLKRHVHKRPPC